MTERAWWKESVVYQIYPRSFKDSNGDGIGDLRGIIEKLDYLRNLGVDVLWLSPIYKSPNDDNGYDISDYRDIMTEFGTMADFDELLKTAHEKGLKIMLDLVVNHTSDEHAWFVESRKSKDNPYRDYYIWRDPVDGGMPNRWQASFGGPVWELDGNTGMYYLHMFSKKQPDLNWDNEKVRDEVFDMMTWWLDKGIDGFRMDVINMISKAEGLPDGAPIPGTPYTDSNPAVMCGPHVHEYLREMNERVLSKYDIMTVGETPCVTVEDGRKFTAADRRELNMVFNFDHVDVENGSGSKWTDKRFKLKDLKDILARWQYGLEDEGWNSLYWNNHDQPRVVSRFGDDGAYRELSAKMLGTCLHMMKGTPYIYQGEELGMTNVRFDTIGQYEDIETLGAYKTCREILGMSEEETMAAIHARSRDNARTPMQWDDSANGGFTAGTPWFAVNPNYTQINAASQVGADGSVYEYYRELIRLRHTMDVIVYGRFDLLLPDSDEVFAYTRTLGAEKLLVLCNFTGGDVKAELPEELKRAEKTYIIGNYGDRPADAGRLRPYEAVVYRTETE